MTHSEPLAGSPDEVKEQLRAEFPDWSIIVSNRGRWWASRSGLVREDLGADACEANDPAALRAELRKKDVPRGGSR